MKKSKSGLLLMEMIICIFFFAVSATVYAQVFAKSHVLSKKTIDEDRASIILSSIAEGFYSTYGDVDKLAITYFPSTAIAEGSCLTIFIDSNYSYIPYAYSSAPNFSDYEYMAQLKVFYDDEITGSAIFYTHRIAQDGTAVTEAIYSIDLKVHKPLTPTELN